MTSKIRILEADAVGQTPFTKMVCLHNPNPDCYKPHLHFLGQSFQCLEAALPKEWYIPQGQPTARGWHETNPFLSVVIWMRTAPTSWFFWMSGSQLVDCLGRIGGVSLLKEVYHCGVLWAFKSPHQSLSCLFWVYNLQIRWEVSAVAPGMCLSATMPLAMMLMDSLSKDPIKCFLL